MRLSVLLTLLIGSLAFAAEPVVLPIWPDKPPADGRTVGEETTQPDRGDNIVRLTNVTKPTISIYAPPAEKNTGAAVLICPGGGYGILAWTHEGVEVAEWLNSIGVTGIVLKYRVPAPKLPTRYTPALQDAQRALGLIRSRAGEFKIDPERIGVLGFSAGGHLSAHLSNNYERRAYDPVDAADEVSCRPDFALPIYPAYLVDKQTNALAPELKVTANTPPTFLVMTQDDGVRVECAVYYYLALKNAGVPVEMHLYPTGRHGYGLRPSQHTVSTWPRRAEEWMRASGLLTPRQSE